MLDWSRRSSAISSRPPAPSTTSPSAASASARSSASDPFCSVEGLTLRHIGRKAPALRDLSLEWGRGERLLLLGPSGSGKSTLALCLDGVIPHSLDAHWEAGRVVVDGLDTREAGLGALCSRVGVLFQDPEAQLAMLEVDDEIAFGLENLGIPRDQMRERIDRARALTGLDVTTPRELNRLSGGTKQRVTLAALLAMRPEGLVLDEPTANLDPAGTRAVFGAIAALCADRDRSLLIVEHRIDEVLGLIDRVAVLDERGHVALTGDGQQVFVERAAELDALGVWTPQLGELARALSVATLPSGPAEAARLLVERWPAGARLLPLRRPATTSALSLDRASYRYPGSTADALRGVSLGLSRGQITAIVGHNAAGKSTLGLLLAGVLVPTAGRVALDGVDLRTVSNNDPRAIRARLAYVFQYPERSFLTRTALDEVAFGLRARGADAISARASAMTMLERFGLGGLAEAEPRSLSHGQKRRLSVATALVTDPEVLVLDEPTFGQDKRATDALMRMLDALADGGCAVVVMTHDLALVADHADRVIALAAGSLAYDGGVAGLFADDPLLARCGLLRPPVAEAVRIARASRPEIPLALGLRDVRAVTS